MSIKIKELALRIANTLPADPLAMDIFLIKFVVATVPVKERRHVAHGLFLKCKFARTFTPRAMPNNLVTPKLTHAPHPCQYMGH